VRSGYLAPLDGKSWFAGQNGYDWSSHGSSARHDGVVIPSAYRLSFNASTVHTSDGPYERWLGFSLRCLSTVLGM